MPDRLDVIGRLTDERNTLELEVTNLWPNLLIGDLQPTAKVQFTHTNVHDYAKDSPLLPSGIFERVPRQNYVRE